MKKLIAVLMSLVIALSVSVMAFAAPTVEKDSSGKITSIMCDKCYQVFSPSADGTKTAAELYNAHLKDGTCVKEDESAATSWKCEYCPKMFTDIDAYNDHLTEYHEAANPSQQAVENRVQFYYDKYVGESIQDVINDMIDLFQKSGIMDYVKVMIEDIWARVMAYIDNQIGSEADVAGSIDDLETKVFSLNLDNDLLSTIKTIINELKQKIKDLYCGERATTVEVTEAAAPANTGSSSSAAIAVFAAVSAAAAAAYVCTKKKA